MNILDQIVAYKKEEVAVRKLTVPEKELLESIYFKRKCCSLTASFSNPLKTGIIAEFKRKSPSKGFINRNADVKAVTAAYTLHGASALSVLTDHHFFGGSSEDLLIARKNDIPILRKDFIIDKYQLVVSKAIGADVILLIAACLEPAAVKALSAFAKELGMETLLEIHDESELNHICADIDMVGINNRNLKDFTVDINRSVALSKLIPAGKIKIAESGIDDPGTVHNFRSAGYAGFLMGEIFMKEKDPGVAFAKFATSLKDKN